MNQVVVDNDDSKARVAVVFVVPVDTKIADPYVVIAAVVDSPSDRATMLAMKRMNQANEEDYCV